MKNPGKLSLLAACAIAFAVVSVGCKGVAADSGDPTTAGNNNSPIPALPAAKPTPSLIPAAGNLFNDDAWDDNYFGKWADGVRTVGVIMIHPNGEAVTKADLRGEVSDLRLKFGRYSKLPLFEFEEDANTGWIVVYGKFQDGFKKGVEGDLALSGPGIGAGVVAHVLNPATEVIINKSVAPSQQKDQGTNLPITTLHGKPVHWIAFVLPY